MKSLTQEQAIVLTGFTAIVMVRNFSDFHEDVEKRLGRPIMINEFEGEEEEIREAYRKDFMRLVL